MTLSGNSSGGCKRLTALQSISTIRAMILTSQAIPLTGEEKPEANRHISTFSIDTLGQNHKTYLNRHHAHEVGNFYFFFSLS